MSSTQRGAAGTGSPEAERSASLAATRIATERNAGLEAELSPRGKRLISRQELVGVRQAPAGAARVASTYILSCAGLKHVRG